MDSYCRKERSIKEIIEKYFIFTELWPFEFEKVEKMVLIINEYFMIQEESILDNIVTLYEEFISVENNQYFRINNLIFEEMFPDIYVKESINLFIK